MKKNLRVFFATLIAICIMPAGCVKDPDGNTIGSPDISSFAIEAVSTWKAGLAAIVSIASATLADGEYIVLYDLTGANMRSGLTAVLTMAGSHGTFTLPVLSNDNGETNVIIRSVSDSGGGSSTVSSNNTYTFSDSTGLMTGPISGSGTFRATHVTASWLGSGSMLSIHGVKWTPLTTVTLYIDQYNGVPTTMTFTQVSDFSGGATYGFPGGSKFGKSGTVTVTASSPLITGTYNFTCEDNTVVSGTFSCPAP